MKRFYMFIMFMLCVTISVNAKKVQVVVQPSSAVVLGEKSTQISDGVYEIPVGLIEKPYVVQRDGFDTKRVTIGLKSPSVINVKLEPNRKNVTVTTSPEDAKARIVVDGVETGTGTAKFQIHKGETKTIKIIAQGFDTYIGQISFNDQYDIEMSKDIQLVANEKKVIVKTDLDNAEIYVDGVLTGKGKSAEITVFKGKESQLLITAVEYLDYFQKITFDSSLGSVLNLSGKMVKDEAFAATKIAADIVNKKLPVTVRSGMTRDQAMVKMKAYITEKFAEVPEIDDSSIGWYRTRWFKRVFPKAKGPDGKMGARVRSRVEFKQNMTIDSKLIFNIKVESQYTSMEEADSDENYQDWDRLLTEFYEMIDMMQKAISADQ